MIKDNLSLSIAMLCFLSFSSSMLPIVIESYFSPADHIQEKLIERIRNEKRSIKAALYLIFDKEVVKELCNAVARGVDIEIIVDSENIEYKWSQIPTLFDAGISIFIYNSKQGILHDKFFIFECNKNNKSLLWTGSYNVTFTANKYNRENVVIIEDDGTTIHKFEKEFEHIKKAAKLYPTRMRKRSLNTEMVIENSMNKKMHERPWF